eukprot:TRINITY_DN25033_c0_g2_i3.p1 TRINITY_DN25033_c0_g2~~TRINITY_DN25033_c0_g2_i3.p1  ORF type:complete len:157 (-),score=51.37 TRINITY_DN25033_c0_g2_i3:175-645(-)
MILFIFFFFFQAEDGIRDAQESRGLGDVYKRQYQRRVRGQPFLGHGGCICTSLSQMTSAKSHDRYARAFVHQRVREVFEVLDSKQDDKLDEEELLSHLWSVGYHASRKAVHDMIWEVDDRSTGFITLEAIRKVLKRLQKSKKRMPGTGTNLSLIHI